MKRPMRAKLFQNGGSQAVRLPKACRFTALHEVLVHREGRKVVLEPADEWSPEFLACLGSISEDLRRPKQASLRSLKQRLD